jgi:hypothetical protein
VYDEGFKGHESAYRLILCVSVHSFALGKSKMGRRRPQSPPGGAGSKKAAATAGHEAEGGAGGGDKAAGEEGECEGDAGMEAAMLLAKKGTNARRKEFRHVMSKADVDHADDVFEGSSFPVS